MKKLCLISLVIVLVIALVSGLSLTSCEGEERFETYLFLWQSDGVSADGTVTFTHDGTEIGGPYHVSCPWTYGYVPAYHFYLPQEANDISWSIIINWGDGTPPENWKGQNQPWPARHIKTHNSSRPSFVAFDEVAPITIGAARSLSGPLASIGKYAFGPVLDYWVDEVNAAGGINVTGEDLPVVLDIQDDESDMDTMRDLLVGMITSGNYDFVFAPVSTAFLQAAATICDNTGYILMGAEGGCTSIMDMLDELPYFFGVLNFADHSQMEELFKLFETWGVETVAEIHNNDLYGLEYSNIAASEAAKYPDIDIVISMTVDPFAEDVEDQLQQAEALNVDVFCAFTYPPTTMAVVAQAIANNITFNAMVLGWGANFQYFYDTFGAATEGIIGLGAWNEDTSAAAADFAADMIAMHGREYMDWWGGLYYYAGLQCFQQAIERAGTLDNDDVRAELAAAWPGSPTNPPFNTVLGNTWFTDADGNPVGAGGGLLAVECHPGQMGQWQSGKFEVIDIGPNRTAVPIYPKPDWP